MSRRPKLSLGPDNHMEKKQAPVFEAGEAAESPPPNAATATNTREGNTRGGDEETQGTRAVEEPLHKETRGTGSRLIKVALVVVAAALSLYLLKRRLT